MPKRDADLLIEDILAAIDKIERYVSEFDREKFLEDEKTVDAVVRNLEIIGEADRQLPDAYTTQYPDVPWRRMAGLRNRIVHDYLGLDLEIIWDVVANDIQTLKAQLTAL